MVFGMGLQCIAVCIYLLVGARVSDANFGLVHFASQLNLEASPANPSLGVNLQQDHHNNFTQTVEKHRRQLDSPGALKSSNSSQDDTIEFKPWPRNEYTWKPTIPFEVQSEDEEVTKMIESAIHQWSKDTCVEFVPKSPSDVNYVLYKYSQDSSMCHATAGRTGKGVQEVLMSETCRTKGYASMYTGLTIGLFPEFLRPDRDAYLVINKENLKLDLINLAKFTNAEVNTHGIGFDYTSALLESSKYLSINDGITFATRIPEYQGLLRRFDGKVSHRNKLMVNEYYNCTKPWLATCGYKNNPCANEGYMGPDCNCVCRLGSFGTHCDYLYYVDYYGYFLPPCSENIEHETVLTSPNFPVFILEDTWCVYTIKAPKNRRVKIHFNKFHIAKRYTVCHDSFLEIRYQSKYHGFMACGNNAEGKTFISATNEMILYLDVSNNSSKGFQAVVTFLDSSSSGTYGMISAAHTMRIPFSCLEIIILAISIYVIHLFGV